MCSLKAMIFKTKWSIFMVQALQSWLGPLQHYNHPRPSSMRICILGYFKIKVMRDDRYRVLSYFSAFRYMLANPPGRPEDFNIQNPYRYRHLAPSAEVRLMLADPAAHERRENRRKRVRARRRKVVCIFGLYWQTKRWNKPS